MSVAVTHDKVSRAAVARALRPLILEAGSVTALAREATSGSRRSAAHWERTLRKWLGEPQPTRTPRKSGKSVQGTVGYDLVDELLTVLGMADLWYGPELQRWGLARPGGSTQPRRYPQRPESKMTLAQIRQAHARHVAGESVRALGRALWETYGYASPSSCANSLSEAFLREGLATRDRIEATKLASTVHGNAGRGDRRSNALRYRVHRKRRRRERGEVRGVKCSATVTGRGTPRPCRNYALADKVHCLQHDPARRGEVLEYVNRIRGACGLALVADERQEAAA